MAAWDGHESVRGQMDLVQEGGGTVALSPIVRPTPDASVPIPSRPDAWQHRTSFAPATAHVNLPSNADLTRTPSGPSLSAAAAAAASSSSSTSAAAPGIDQLVLMQSDESFRSLFRPCSDLPAGNSADDCSGGSDSSAMPPSWRAGHRFDEEEFANHRQREYPHTPQPLRPIEPRALRKIRRRIERADEARRLAKHAGTGIGGLLLRPHDSALATLADSSSKSSPSSTGAVDIDDVVEMAVARRPRRSRRSRSDGGSSGGGSSRKVLEPFQPTLDNLKECHLEEACASSCSSSQNLKGSEDAEMKSKATGEADEQEADDCERTMSIASGDSGAASGSPTLRNESAVSEDLTPAAAAASELGVAIRTNHSSSTAILQLDSTAVESAAVAASIEIDDSAEQQCPTPCVVTFFVGGDLPGSDINSSGSGRGCNSSARIQQPQQRRRSSQQHQTHHREYCYTPLDLARRTFSGNEILMEEFRLDPEEASQLGESDQDNVKSHRFDDLQAMRRHKINPALAAATVQRCYSTAVAKASASVSQSADACGGLNCRSEPVLLTPASASSVTVDALEVSNLPQQQQQLLLSEDESATPGSPLELPETEVHVFEFAPRSGQDQQAAGQPISSDYYWLETSRWFGQNERRRLETEDRVGYWSQPMTPVIPFHAIVRFRQHLELGSLRLGVENLSQMDMDNDANQLVAYLLDVCRQELLLADGLDIITEALTLLGQLDGVGLGPSSIQSAMGPCESTIVLVAESLSSMMQSPLLLLCHLRSTIDCPLLSQQPIRCLFLTGCRQVGRLFACLCGDAEFQRQLAELDHWPIANSMPLTARRRPRRELVQYLHSFLDRAVLVPAHPSAWSPDAIEELVTVEKASLLATNIVSADARLFVRNEPVGLLADVRLLRKIVPSWSKCGSAVLASSLPALSRSVSVTRLICLLLACALAWTAAGGTFFATKAGYNRGAGASVALLAAGFAQLVSAFLLSAFSSSKDLAIVLGPSASALTIEATICLLANGLGLSWISFRSLCCFYCALWSSGCLLLAPSHWMYSLTAGVEELLSGFSGFVLLSWTAASLSSSYAAIVCLGVLFLAIQMRQLCHQSDRLNAGVKRFLGNIVVSPTAFVIISSLAIVVGLPEIHQPMASELFNQSNFNSSNSSLVLLPWQLVTMEIANVGATSHAIAIAIGASAAVLLLGECAACWLRRLVIIDRSVCVSDEKLDRIGGAHLAGALVGVAMPLLAGLLGWPLIGSDADLTIGSVASVTSFLTPSAPSAACRRQPSLAFLLGSLLALIGAMISIVIAVAPIKEASSVASSQLALIAALHGLVALMAVARLRTNQIPGRLLSLIGLPKLTALNRIGKHSTGLAHWALQACLLALLSGVAVASSIVMFYSLSKIGQIVCGCLLAVAPCLTLIIYAASARYCCSRWNLRLAEFDPPLCPQAAAAAAAAAAAFDSDGDAAMNISQASPPATPRIEAIGSSFLIGARIRRPILFANSATANQTRRTSSKQRRGLRPTGDAGSPDEAVEFL